MGETPEWQPCPFCGAKNRVHVGFIGNTNFYLSCGNCGAHGPLAPQMTGGPLDMERMWNRRTPPNPEPEDVK